MLEFNSKAKILINKLKENEKQLYSAEEIIALESYRYNLNESPLQGMFVPELISELFNIKKYTKLQDRKKFQVSYAGGEFYDSNSYWLNGSYIYCLLKGGRLFAAPMNEELHHSYLVAGLPVIAAGTMEFMTGKLISISNNSGHYKVSFKTMLKVLPQIYQMACNPNLFFQDHSFFWQKNNLAEVVDYSVNTLIQFSDWEDLNLAQQHCREAHKAYCSMVISKASKNEALESSPLMNGYSSQIVGNKSVVDEKQNYIRSNFFSSPKIKNS